MKREQLTVTVSCEGQAVAKENCSANELGQTIQTMIDAASAFDDVKVEWFIDEDELAA